MNNQIFASRQNSSSQILVLRKSFVKCDDLKVGTQRKSCQIGIGPDVRRKQGALSQRTPAGFKARGLCGKHDADIGKQVVIETPCISHRHGIHWKNLSIRRQSKKSLLSQPAEATTPHGHRLHPCLGRNMVNVGLEGECNPEVDIRKMHLPRPSTHRSFHWSSGHCLARMIGQAGTQPVFGFWRPVSLAIRHSSQSLRPLRATARHHQTRPHHFRFVL